MRFATGNPGARLRAASRHYGAQLCGCQAAGTADGRGEYRSTALQARRQGRRSAADGGTVQGAGTAAWRARRGRPDSVRAWGSGRVSLPPCAIPGPLPRPAVDAGLPAHTPCPRGTCTHGPSRLDSLYHVPTAARCAAWAPHFVPCMSCLAGRAAPFGFCLAVLAAAEAAVDLVAGASNLLLRLLFAAGSPESGWRLLYFAATTPGTGGSSSLDRFWSDL